MEGCDGIYQWWTEVKVEALPSPTGDGDPSFMVPALIEHGYGWLLCHVGHSPQVYGSLWGQAG
jgi:hypothetical protein